MDIENTKRSQVKIQKTAGVEQCFPGWVSNLDGRSTHDGATARRPRYQARATAVLVWNGGSGPLPLWLSWLWHTKDGKLMVKLSGQRSVAGNGASPARCVRRKFPPPNLKKPVQARAAWQIWLRWCHSAVQRT